MKITKLYTVASVTSPLQVELSIKTAVSAGDTITLTMTTNVFPPKATGTGYLNCYFRKIMDSQIK